MTIVERPMGQVPRKSDWAGWWSIERQREGQRMYRARVTPVKKRKRTMFMTNTTLPICS